MKEKLMVLLEVYKTSIRNMENSIENGDATTATEYRYTIEKKCYNIFIEQLETIIKENK